MWFVHDLDIIIITDYGAFNLLIDRQRMRTAVQVSNRLRQLGMTVPGLKYQRVEFLNLYVHRITRTQSSPVLQV